MLFLVTQQRNGPNSTQPCPSPTLKKPLFSFAPFPASKAALVRGSIETAKTFLAEGK